MEAFLSSLPLYVHEFLDKEPPYEVFNVLRELVCFAVLYSNDYETIRLHTERLLEGNNSAQTFIYEGQEPQYDSGKPIMDPESTNSPSHHFEQVVPDKNIPAGPPDSKPYESHSVQSPIDNERKAELPRQSNYATHTKVAGISDAQDQHQANRKKGRPQSAIFTSPGYEPIPRPKTYDNYKRNSIAVSTPRRMSSSFSQDLKKEGHGHEVNRNANSPGGLERRAQTVSARLSYLAQPKRVSEPVKSSRSDTMPTTFPIAPRTTPLVKPAQTALVKARSVRARTKADDKPTAKAVVAPTPAYVQNAKSKIDWEAIKRERRATQIESTSFEFVPFDENDQVIKKDEHEETKVEDGEAVP